MSATSFYLAVDELRVPMNLQLAQFTSSAQRPHHKGNGGGGKTKTTKGGGGGGNKAGKKNGKQAAKDAVQAEAEAALATAQAEANAVPPLPEERLQKLSQVDGILALSKGTKPLYLLDTYRFDAATQAVSIEPDTDAKEPGGYVIVTEASVFHPQGGGQPSDKGFMYLGGTLPDGDTEDKKEPDGTVFTVEMVRMLPDGRIAHRGRFADSAAAVPAAPCQAVLKIDEIHRRLAARIHSGGHILDEAMERTVRSQEISMPVLKATKGYHFPEASYVQFAGAVPAESRDALKQALQTHVNSIIAEQRPTKMYLCTQPEELQSLCFYGSWSEEQLAKNGWLRVICAGGRRGCPCGGTHVQNTSELGQLEITKISVRKGMTKISYKMGAAASA